MLMDENFKLQNELNVLHHQLADIMAITDSIEIEREANFCVKNDVEALQIKFQELTQKIPESFEDNKDIVMIAHRHSEKSHREDQLEQKHHEIFNDQKDIKIAELEKLLTENHQEFLKNQERVELVESLQSQVDQLNSRIQLCHVMEQQNIDKILDLEKMVTACQEKNAALNQKQLDSVENLQKLKEIEKDFMDNKERALELEKINKSLEDDLSAKSRTISMTSATMRESIEHIKNCIEDHCNDKVKLLKTWIEELQSENEKLKSFRQKVLNKRPCECHSVTMGSKLDMICHKILICGLGSLQFDELFYLYNELYLVIVKIKDVDSMGGFSGASIFDKTEGNIRSI